MMRIRLLLTNGGRGELGMTPLRVGLLRDVADGRVRHVDNLLVLKGLERVANCH
jgi:hypothetical protein